mmetsp:Transcript_42206/g.97721  ORF Transcript_42206/g.97721 Transcript_42206/m.97721 type:complete len:263 (+) Transcript_42206:48-836(+)
MSHDATPRAVLLLVGVSQALHVPSQEAMQGHFTVAAAEWALQKLNVVYDGHADDPFYIDRETLPSSIDKAWEQMNESTAAGDASLYGEILPSSVLAMLASVGAKPGMRFYDLGCGYGKTALLAGLLGLKATGVELVDERWAAACDSLELARGEDLQPGQVRIVHGDLLKFDFSNADIVFTDSLAFSEHMMEKLSRQALTLRPGAKVITALPFDERWFNDLGSFKAPSSWASNSTWLIQGLKPGLDAAAQPALEVEEMDVCSS